MLCCGTECDYCGQYLAIAAPITFSPVTLNNALDYRANGLLSDPTIGLWAYPT